MDGRERTFTIDDHIFTIRRTAEPPGTGLVLTAGESGLALLADALTAFWMLKPVDLVDGIASGRSVTLGEFSTLYAGDDADRAGHVTIVESEDAITLPMRFVMEVVAVLAAEALDTNAADRTWVDRLSDRGRKLLGLR